MIEPIPASLLRYFHETNYTTRLEVERHAHVETIRTMNGIEHHVERDIRWTFEMLVLITFDGLGQPDRDAAMLKAFCLGWVSGHRTVEATVGSQPYRLTAVRGDYGRANRNYESLTVTGHAFRGEYASSDAARVAIASLPPPPVKVGPRSIVSLKQRGLEL